MVDRTLKSNYYYILFFVWCWGSDKIDYSPLMYVQAFVCSRAIIVLTMWGGNVFRRRTDTMHKIDDVGLNVLRCLADISGTKK